MGKKTKVSGSNFERRVKRYLEEIGWKVFRSAGSKSCADLLAFSKREGCGPLWIQCKASETPTLTASEKIELFTGHKFYPIEVLIVCRENMTWKFKYYMFEGIGSSKLVEVEEPAWLRE